MTLPRLAPRKTSAPSKRRCVGRGCAGALAASLFLLALIPSASALTSGALAPETVSALLAQVGDADAVVTVGDMRFDVEDLKRIARESTSSGPDAKLAQQTGIRLWPEGRVPFRFAETVTSAQRASFLAACRRWERAAGVRFVEAGSETDFLVVMNGSTNTSYVGRRGGAQPLTLVDWDAPMTICHELGHALGMVHEHSRSDRDLYVTILTQNIIAGQEFAFARAATRNLTPYDFLSVMHYVPNAFSRTGLFTIVPTPAYRQFAFSMGYATDLSPLDEAGMAMMYPVRPGATLEWHPQPPRLVGGRENRWTLAVGNPGRADRFRVRVRATNPPGRLRVAVGATDVTSRAFSGGYLTPTVGVGSAVRLAMRARLPQGSRGMRLRLVVTAESQSSGTITRLPASLPIR